MKSFLSVLTEAAATGVYAQLIQPKLAKTMQKPPRTTSQACRPPSGGGPKAGAARLASGTDFSGSVFATSGLGVPGEDEGAELSSDVDMAAMEHDLLFGCFGSTKLRGE